MLMFMNLKILIENYDFPKLTLPQTIAALELNIYHTTIRGLLQCCKLCTVTAAPGLQI